MTPAEREHSDETSSEDPPATQHPGPFVELDLNDSELTEQPFEALAEARSNCPVARGSRYGGYWVLTRYEDVAAAARDWKTFSSAHGVSIPRSTDRVFVPIGTDPPFHSEMRRVLNPALSVHAVGRWEQGVREIADQLVDSFAARGRADLGSEFGGRLPGLVTFRLLLGFPEADLEECIRWSHGTKDERTETGPDDEQSSFSALAEYADNQIRKRAGEAPRGDLIDVLREATIDGQGLDDETMLMTVLTIVFGGLTTTASAIGNSLLHLATHPDDRQRLIDDPRLITEFVEEILRFEAPILALGRTVTDDVIIGDQQLAAGDKVWLSWAAANRDPSEFEEPDEVILGRTANRHLAFGIGIHRCLGMHLARLQIRVALETALRRIPDFRVEPGSQVRYMTGTARGVERLIVDFTPEHAAAGR